MSVLAVGRQGQCYAVCVYTPAQCAPQPLVALEGASLMSFMYSMSLSETCSLPTYPQGGSVVRRGMAELLSALFL